MGGKDTETNVSLNHVLSGLSIRGSDISTPSEIYIRPSDIDSDYVSSSASIQSIYPSRESVGDDFSSSSSHLTTSSYVWNQQRQVQRASRTTCNHQRTFRVNENQSELVSPQLCGKRSRYHLMCSFETETKRMRVVDSQDKTVEKSSSAVLGEQQNKICIIGRSKSSADEESSERVFSVQSADEVYDLSRWRTSVDSEHCSANAVSIYIDANEQVSKEDIMDVGHFPNVIANRCCHSDNSSFSNWLPIVSAVAFWYISSMTITALNKWLFDNLQFTYPLLVTFTHFTMISLFLQIGFTFCNSVCSTFPQVSRQHYLQFIAPIAFFGASEIALSNLAYSMVSLSVMTVIKSSLAVVTYLLSVCFGLERFSCKLLSIVLLIMGSILLTVPGLTFKSGIGVITLCFAVLFAALRWVVIHHQLQKQNFTPLQLMVLTQPLSSVFLAVPAAAVDIRHLIEAEGDSPDTPRLMAATLLICCTVVLAFLVIFAEYNLVRNVHTVVLLQLLFGEHIGVIPSIGIACSIAGIFLYSRLRINQLRAFKELQRLPTSDLSRSSSLNLENGIEIPSNEPDTVNSSPNIENPRFVLDNNQRVRTTAVITAISVDQTSKRVIVPSAASPLSRHRGDHVTKSGYFEVVSPQDHLNAQKPLPAISTTSSTESDHPSEGVENQ